MSQTQEKDAKEIWDELDAEDLGGTKPEPEHKAASESPQDNPPADLGEPSDQHPEEGEGDGDSPSAEQALMDRIQGLEALLTQTTDRLHRAEGRIGGLNAELGRQRETAKKLLARGADAPTDKELKDAQEDPEAMKALKENYPEFADAMKAALQAEMSRLESRLKPQRAEETPDPLVSANERQPHQSQTYTPEDVASLRNELRVEVKHPGWQDKVRTPQFFGWLQRQQREVVMLAHSDRAEDAIRLLDLYEGESQGSKRSDKRLESAAGLTTGRNGTRSRQTKTADDMTPEEYWAYLDEKDRQQRVR